MRTGNWHVGGSTIDLDTGGNLLNGQHRLHACIQADVSFSVAVIRGANPEAQIGMDHGLHRTLSDYLAWKGETNTSTLASAINLSWKWQQGRVTWTTVPTYSEALNWLERNPSIRAVVLATNGIRQQLSAPPSALASFAHQVTMIDAEEADAFLKQLREGDALKTGDPILALRNWMINQITRAASGSKPATPVYLAVLVKAWNAWANGRDDVKTLVWRRGGRNKEEFPALVDLDGNPVEIRDELQVALDSETGTDVGNEA